MNELQTEALELIKQDILFDANSDDTQGEYVEVDGSLMIRTMDGTLSAIETGKYEILLRPMEEDAYHVEIVTDYGFCKATSFAGIIKSDGTFNYE